MAIPAARSLHAFITRVMLIMAIGTFQPIGPSFHVHAIYGDPHRHTANEHHDHERSSACGTNCEQSGGHAHSANQSHEVPSAGAASLLSFPQLRHVRPRPTLQKLSRQTFAAIKKPPRLDSRRLMTSTNLNGKKYDDSYVRFGWINEDISESIL